MEDILASIRRIIADDQTQAGRSGLGSLRRGGAAPLPLLAPPDEAEDIAEQSSHPAFDEVLDLARMPEAVVAEPAALQPLTVAESYHPAAAAEEAYEEEADPVASDQGVVHSYVNSYAAPAPLQETTVRYSQPAMEQPAPPSSYAAEPPQPVRSRQLQANGDGTEPLLSPALGASVMSSFETLAATVVLQNDDMLDRIMHDLMRPLLKTWLEENLPTLVERLVRAEIERVARGGRG